MRTNYILIDSENVQPEAEYLACALSASEQFRAHIFYGANQKNVSRKLLALQPFGVRVKHVTISGNGPNALDFHIAFYIGHLAAQDQEAYFHIISKDTGFDPLIDHLKAELKIHAGRRKSITDIPLVKSLSSKTPKDRAAAVRERLESRKSGKPATVKTLDNEINHVFQNQLTAEEITAIRIVLVKENCITITGTKVSYNLPNEASTPPAKTARR